MSASLSNASGRSYPLGIEHDAHGGGGEDLVAADDERLAHAVQDAPGDGDGVPGRGDLLQQDGELVAAEPGQGVHGPAAGFQHAGHAPEQFVAGLVAQGVVDDLEPVQVHVDDREQVPAAAAALHGQAQVVQEQGAVGQPGQGIVEGLALELVLGLLAQGDVLKRPLVTQDRAVLVRDLAGVLGHPDDAPVAAAHLGHEILDLVLLPDQPEKFLAPRGVHVHLGADVVDRAHEGIRGVVAHDPGQGRVHGQEPPAGRGLVDALHRVLENGAVLFLRLAQRLADDLSLGDLDLELGVGPQKLAGAVLHLLLQGVPGLLKLLGLLADALLQVAHQLGDVAGHGTHGRSQLAHLVPGVDLGHVRKVLAGNPTGVLGEHGQGLGNVHEKDQRDDEAAAEQDEHDHLLLQGGLPDVGGDGLGVHADVHVPGQPGQDGTGHVQVGPALELHVALHVRLVPHGPGGLLDKGPDLRRHVRDEGVGDDLPVLVGHGHVGDPGDGLVLVDARLDRPGLLLQDGHDVRFGHAAGQGQGLGLVFPGHLPLQARAEGHGRDRGDHAEHDHHEQQRLEEQLGSFHGRHSCQSSRGSNRPSTTVVK